MAAKVWLYLYSRLSTAGSSMLLSLAYEDAWSFLFWITTREGDAEIYGQRLGALAKFLAKTFQAKMMETFVQNWRTNPTWSCTVVLEEETCTRC